MRRGGFNAIVSNPPFMGGQKLTGQLGEDLREYLIQDIGRGKRGSADLCSYFLLRDLSIAPRRPRSASSPRTRSPRATPARSASIRPWTWTGRSIGPRSPSAGQERRRWRCPCSGLAMRRSTKSAYLDGNRVADITPSLDPPSRMSAIPYRWLRTQSQSFQGSICSGDWIHLEPEEALGSDLRRDPRNKAYYFRTSMGRISTPAGTVSASRWVINFHDWPIERAQAIPECFDRSYETSKAFPGAEQSVRCTGSTGGNTQTHADHELYVPSPSLDRVLVIARVSRHRVASSCLNSAGI